MNTGFVRESIDEEIVGRSSQPIMCKKNTVEILRMQLLLAFNEGVTFRRRHNGRGAACCSAKNKSFENTEGITIQGVKCSEKPKIYLKEK